MDDDSVNASLQIADYVAFGVLLGLSCAIGVYFGYKDRKHSTTDVYFFGGRSMNPIAVGMSMAVSFASAISFISLPAECYIVGTVCMWNVISRILPAILGIVYFIPVFYRLSLRTTFQFLEFRFDARLRRVAATMKVVSEIFYVGLVVYVPAVSINAVTPIPLNWSIVLTAVVGTFYTTLGGMKAVIWTDALQLVFMLIGAVAISIRGLMDIGGLDNVLLALKRGERYTAFRFDYGLISRVSPLATILGTCARYTNAFALSQQFVQRAQSCKTARHAQYALAINAIYTIVLGFALIGTGMMMYPYFEGCDPVLSGQISAIDQAVPYMALQLFTDLPGMIGLFIASIFSASLSTISSSLNSFAIIIVEDILVPYWKRLSESERLKLIVGKIAVLVIGALLLAVAFAASFSRSNIIQLLFGFSGVIVGPLVGTFILGFFFPWTSSLGAVIGLVTSVGFGLFMFIANEFLKVPYPSNIPPRSADECVANATLQPEFLDETTETSELMSSTATPEIERSAFQNLCNLNYNTFIFVCMVGSMLVGLLASFVSGPNKPSEADPRFFIPLVDNPCFPKSVRKFFRFGVPEPAEKMKCEISSILEEDKL